MLDNFLSQLLYGISGYLFGIFACRFGNISIHKAWLLEMILLPSISKPGKLAGAEPMAKSK